MGIVKTFVKAWVWAACAWGSVAGAQDFPSKPVRIVVPYPPSGTTDFLARLYAQKLAQLWGQPVVVENRAGASGNIGMEAVAKSPPDGYTLAMVNNSVAINGSLYPTQSFDLVRDFAPLGLVASTPMILGAYAGSSIKSLGDLTAQAKSQSGKLTFASCGNGTPQHLAVELYMAIEKISLLHIPYKGCAPAVSDVLGGQVQLLASTSAVMAPLFKSGRLVPLAQTAKKRSAIAPDVPTFAESGVSGYELDIWYGLLAPAETPIAVRQKISSDLLRIAKSKEVIELMKTSGIDELIGAPEDMSAVVKTDLEKYATLIRKIGLKAD